ncbi:MAG: FAD binding domain-containing protein [Gemmataceae bacterium]|nr:FAD binding domain-containing protein [Gemmataceae bacterium]
MKNFSYFRPTTVEQALALLENRWGNTEMLAGGTDLLDLQKEYVAQPNRVVSLTGIKGLAGIEVDGQNPARWVKIGAGTRLADIAGDRQIQQRFPALAGAAGNIGGPQIRNMGTLGGNLCQRNRCWYFRDEHVRCLLKGGERCFALDGENRYHAIFTQGHRCVIVSPSTLAPILIALGATAEVAGPQGRRNVELAKFFRAPSNATEREHNLASNEMVLSVTVPSRGLATGNYEVQQKAANDWPLVQASVAFQHSDGKASGARIVLGHVAPTPLLSEAAGKALEGRAVSEETATAAGRAAAEGARPLSQNAYKVRLVEVAVKRALLIAAGQRRYWEV